MGFFQDLLQSILMEACNLWVSLFGDLGRTVFFMEDAVGDAFPVAKFHQIYLFVQAFALSLVILKALKKGFMTYILWRDGDPDENPGKMVVNIGLAVALAVSFPTLYDWFASVVLWLAEQLSIASFDMLELDSWHDLVTATQYDGGLYLIILIIYFIMLFVLYLSFLKRSAELMILRLGFPLATLGLLDSDNGVFSTTVKVFIQVSLTTIVQLFFMMLSMMIFLKSKLALMNPFLCIACCLAAFATPKMLQNILLPTGGSGVGSKVNTASQAIHIVKGLKGG